MPAAAAAVLLAVHLHGFYQVVKTAGAQPSSISTVIWVLVELVLPHYYMYRATQLSGVGQSARNAANAAGDAAFTTRKAQYPPTVDNHFKDLLQQGGKLQAADEAGGPSGSGSVSPPPATTSVAPADGGKARAAGQEGMQQPPAVKNGSGQVSMRKVNGRNAW